MHAAGIVHRALAPHRFLVDDDDRAFLTGFGYAIGPDVTEPLCDTGLEWDDADFVYTAPELGTRMNLRVDARADLYSLGCILYEQLTGVPPFDATDAAGAVHAHATHSARPPHELVPHVPEQISRIVVKLLEKAPEQRYGTAASPSPTCSDVSSAFVATGAFRCSCSMLMRRCSCSKLITWWAVTRRSMRCAHSTEPWPPVERCASHGFPATRASASRRCCWRPSRESGTTGRCSWPPARARKGAAARRTRCLPRRWSRCCSSCSVARTTNSTCGARESERPWRPSGARSRDSCRRFRRCLARRQARRSNPNWRPGWSESACCAIARLIACFAAPERPLALLLDDLQWADAGTIQVLERLVQQHHDAALLLVGAYRGNEIDAHHPLRAGPLADVPDALTVELGPLNERATTELIAHALHQDTDALRPLSDLIGRRTGRNPFFVHHLLRLLADEGMLDYDAGAGRWRWNMARIAAHRGGDDVAMMLARQFELLPDAARFMLRLLACIGQRASARLLATAAGLSEADASRGCRRRSRPAVSSATATTGRSGTIAFARPRMRRSEAERAPLHHAIACRLLAAGDACADAFVLAAQANLGRTVVETPAQLAHSRA